MPLFTLKHYVRQNPEVATAGTLQQEWAFEAKTMADAVCITQNHFSQQYDERTDFMVLWDENGKHVWGNMTDA